MAVSYSESFQRQLKRLRRKYHRIHTDVQPVIAQLEAGETPGDPIQGVGHAVYKVRVRNTDARRGKSEGYRIIYYVQQRNAILLVTIYSKIDQSDIEVNDILQIIREEAG